MKSDGTKWINNFRRTAYEWLFGNFKESKMLSGNFKESEMPKWVILPFENPDLYSNKEFLTYLENTSQYKTLIIGHYKNTKIGLLSSKFGASAIAMTVDVLALAGVRGIIGIGFCGGLKKDLKSGEFIIPEGAVRDEGASEAYVPKCYPAVADAEVVSTLQKAAIEANKNVELGVVWSTDGILRETDEKIQYWKERYVLAVDMETSSFLTVARALGIKAGNILVVSDNPGDGRQADYKALHEGYQVAVKLVLDATAALIKGNTYDST